MTKIERLKKFLLPAVMWLVFETVAVTLWLTKQNIFYLFNFSYIGTSMLVYLGLICNENMQIEGFWYYLFTAD